ncbi:Penicillin-binding protein 2 [Candidatus Megaera venefica]|uniref:Penicillin-binding protein 2 n=1 Tax=Candidatus Megaera venefica TaxID=2055910 RepID=A0ABU5NDM8_9RICK|nr:penicillin-binding protein 2 [Candidatus Megaera venefica]MBY0533947.1 penicillin-binding protein 2 [Rickettsiaceae bacterium]MEA0971269.1 Penicillin-binding protein 2 [Candidatus Megaera venefica]
MLDRSSLNRQIMTRRTFVIGAGKLGLLFLLAGRMFYMQFIKKDEYRTLSDNNRIKMILLSPTRGQIFDSDGVIIAKNNTCFRLLLDKNGNPKYSEEINHLVEILELDDYQIDEIKRRMSKGGRRVAAIVIDCLDWNQVAVIEERKADFKSLFIDTGFERFYKSGLSTAHLIGYLGRPGTGEDEPTKLADETFKVGKGGIEKFYEEHLRGEFGFKRIEVNALGKYVRELGKSASKPGNDLYLNINAELQENALKHMNAQGCSAIVMDCTNGNIIICASTPSFDPNKFSKLSNQYWNSLINDPYKPLIDKTTKSLYPPGSVFKIITALAALEAGIDPDNKIICTGAPILGGNSFRCSRSRGHGALNMVDALKHSCNHYIYAVARQTGADKIIEVANKFGLGKPTGVDLPGELSGFVPTKQWKMEKYGTKWGVGDTLNLSIGQGFILATPMQLACLITAIASNGKLFSPKIAVGAPNYVQLDLQQSNLEIIKTALFNTMNTPGGTGYLSRLDYKSMHMAGKTGTAQVQAKKNASDDLSRDNIAWGSRNHAIFSGYAPFDNPKYAISIYFDHGGGGGRASAPIAKKIMQDVLLKYL